MFTRRTSSSPSKQITACKSDLQFAYGGTSDQFMDNASSPSVSLTKGQYALLLHVQMRLVLGVLAAFAYSAPTGSGLQ